MARNDEYWQEITDKPPFSNTTESIYTKQAWHWLEKLENNGKLSQLQLIQLGALLNNVYQAGVEHGREN